MDLFFQKPAVPPPGVPTELGVDEARALVMGRIETFDHPQGKPDFRVHPLESRHDMICARPGFWLTVTNEFGQPERVRLEYARQGVTQPDELTRNFDPDRIPEIATNPDDIDHLPLPKRAFVKEAAIVSLAEAARHQGLPPDLAEQCRGELARLANVLAMTRRLLALLKGRPESTIDLVKDDAESPRGEAANLLEAPEAVGTPAGS